MKHLFLILCTFAISITTKAQQNTLVTLLENSAKETILDIQIGSIQQIETKPNEYKIVLNKATQLLEKGNPDLPKLAYSFALPTANTSQAEIIESQFYDIKNINISPSKGNILRTINPKDVAYTYSSAYQENKFFPELLYSKTQSYTLRDVDADAYHIYPTQYNAITKILRVYTHLKIKITYQKNPNATVKEKIKPIDEFEDLYKNRFINYATTTTTANKVLFTPITDQGALLILSPQEYISTLAPFIKWKEMKGIKVQLVNIDTLPGGLNYTTIKNCITTYNNTLNQAYILLVGDANKIPVYGGAVYGSSDNGYTYYTNDHYPDCVIGRLSAESITDLQKQLNKTITYEKDRNTSSNWMQQQIGIASDEGAGGDGDENQADWEHIRQICDSNKNQYNYLQNIELYDASHGGNDAPGNPTFTDVKTATDNGVSLVNYAGHGDKFNIVTTNTTTTEIPLLNNTAGKWPFYFIVGCQTGNFVNFTCFAETLARNGSLNNETGAIASFMSTVDQWWAPPMQAQDEFNAIMRRARSTNLKTTLGSICVDACASMNDEYNTVTWPNDGNQMTDSWVFFGDPTVELYTKNEGVISCSNISKLIQNTTVYSVDCNVEGATVGLYYQGKYLAHAKVIGGVATFSFPVVTVLDSVLITATKQNYTPFLGKTYVALTGDVGTSNILNSNEINVFPNPANTFINFQTSYIINTIEIHDILGNKLLEQKSNKINIATLPKGIYIATIRTNQGIAYKKFIKE
jgi:gingipain R